MPGANFCQGCGRPLSAEIEPNKPAPSETAQPPRQHVCFRCSAPLAADAKVCEKCGLDVENLINPPPQSQPPGRAADLAEVTFFSQPPPPDPQLAALKNYATWFAAMMFAIIASFAAYSWLEASNVIGRLIGENAPRTQVQTLEPLSAVNSRQTSVPSFIKGDAGGNDAGNAVAPDAESTPAAAPAETLVAKSAEADKGLPDNKAVKKAKAKAATPSNSVSDVNTTAPASDVLLPLPAAKPEMETAEQPLPIGNPEQAFAPEAVPVQSQAESPPAAAVPPAPQAKPRKRVIVTQIEPNKNSKGGAKVASPVEDFFRRWKKSIKQGVNDRPCTQQEKALNQCYN